MLPRAPGSGAAIRDMAHLGCREHAQGSGYDHAGELSRPARPFPSRPAATLAKPMEIEILIADDHGLIREGLRTLLDAEDDLRVVGEARTADEALALARHLHPDVVVLDVRLPDRSGIEVCAEIHDLSPTTKVLVCSGLADGSALVEAAKAGAEGFVSKEATNAEIVDAVRRVAGGASVVGEGSAQTMFGYLRSHRGDTPRLAALSDRERQVLGLLSEGLTNREIGSRLFISEKTVRNHVSGLLRKLHLRHRTEAALFAAPLKGELNPDS